MELLEITLQGLSVKGPNTSVSAKKRKPERVFIFRERERELLLFHVKFEDFWLRFKNYYFKIYERCTDSVRIEKRTRGLTASMRLYF